MAEQKNYNYNPVATMENSDGSGDSGIIAGGGLASTHSSQQLMPNDAESMIAGIGTNDRGTNNQNAGGGGFSSISRKNWFTVSVLCFINLINYMDRFTIAGVLTDIQNELKIQDDDGGLLQTAFVISYMIFAPVFGYLGDRYSRRWIMGIGVFIWSATTLLGSFMSHFGWFITFRAFVGIGEASYSTIAPTLISDLFVGDMRSKMLAMFYFAIPVGSGLGYIVGSETALLAGNWRWALRVTPVLGTIAVILLFLIKEPARGESEGSHNMGATTYKEDLKDLVKNRSFMLSTCGFTCVAFVTGALAWWGPKFIYLGLRLQPGNENITVNDVSYKFGLVAMLAGIIGVPMGSLLATHLRPTHANVDPMICACALFISSPLVYFGLILPGKSEIACLLFVFLAQLSLNMCWSIVADMILYVVVPTRRSTAEAFQILISHAFGDAGSPYLVGVISEAIKRHLRQASHVKTTLGNIGIQSLALTMQNTTKYVADDTFVSTFEDNSDPDSIKFQGLQYALFSTSFVELLGGVFFLITAVYILQDKMRAIQAVRDCQATPKPSDARAAS